MADPAPSNVAQLFNVATIRGRITESRFHEGRYYTAVQTPAPDEYSHPQTLEISSDKALGQKGQDITQGVRLGGSVHRFDRQANPQTGEVGGKGSIIRIRLIAVEG